MQRKKADFHFISFVELLCWLCRLNGFVYFLYLRRSKFVSLLYTIYCCLFLFFFRWVLCPTYTHTHTEVYATHQKSWFISVYHTKTNTQIKRKKVQKTRNVRWRKKAPNRWATIYNSKYPRNCSDIRRKWIIIKRKTIKGEQEKDVCAHEGITNQGGGEVGLQNTKKTPTTTTTEMSELSTKYREMEHLSSRWLVQFRPILCFCQQQQQKKKNLLVVLKYFVLFSVLFCSSLEHFIVAFGMFLCLCAQILQE